ARERSTVTVVVQVNGKLRGKVVLPVGTDRDSASEAALAEPNVQRHVDGKTVRKVIFVPDKLLNIVVS
ncbi:MAG: hypothetical protein HKN58_05860, partial [Xanthomonadales bacterium]|nr:hypothetical protein [Xanthomonadales bacterium]